MPLPPDNLSDYLAVPGRIIPIPGTDYVVIAPDWEKYKARSSEGEADVYHDVNQQMQGISPIFPVQKAETDSPQSPSFPLSANISQQASYGPPSHSSFPQPAFPHHSQNFQSTSLQPSLPSQSVSLHSSLTSQSANIPPSQSFQSASLHPSLASQSINLHPSLASSSASNLPQASDLPSLKSRLEVVASGSAPRKRGRPRKHVDPCQCPNCRREPGHSTQHRHACHHAGCGRTFTKRNHLEAHLLNHAGARPFVCSQPGCSASFVRYDELKRHSWLHTDSGRAQCEWCHKTFNRLDHFKIHKKNCYLAAPAEFVVDGLVSDYDYGSGGADGGGGGNAAQNTQAGDAGGLQ